MIVAERRSSEDTRALILATAWNLFRELGARTTIADVADKLGMSSANVYRFYASKQALCEAVSANQLGAMTAAAREIAAGPGAPAERIRAILLMLHHAMRHQMTNQSRVHEIVEIAIREHWSPINDYQESCDAIVAELVAEGQARGELGPGDPLQLAGHVYCACACIHHPTMIAHKSAGKETLGPEAIVDFALRALAHRGPSPENTGA
jgi:AcrR family transcriptional regulator